MASKEEKKQKAWSDVKEEKGKAVVEADEEDEGSTSKDIKNRVENPNSETESDSDSENDVLEKVREKLAKLVVGHEMDIILEWMEEILNGLEDVRRELSSLQRARSCKPTSGA